MIDMWVIKNIQYFFFGIKQKLFMHKMKRITEIVEQREKSPRPIPSQSPDFANRNVIVATRAPSKYQIADKLNMSTPTNRSKAPLLFDEISQLRQQNENLKRQIEKLSSGPKKSNPQNQSFDNNNQLLLKEINRKDKEITYLKSQIKSLTQEPKYSSRKIALTKSFNPIDNNKALQTRINEIIQENDQIKKSLKQDEVKKLQQKILELQNQNNQLSKILAKHGGNSYASNMSPSKQKHFTDTYYIRPEPKKLSEYELAQLKENFLRQVNNIEDQVYNNSNKKIDELELKLQNMEQMYQKLANSIKKPSLLDTIKSGRQSFPLNSTAPNTFRTPPRGQQIKDFTPNKSHDGYNSFKKQKNLQDELSQARSNLKELKNLVDNKNEQNIKLTNELFKLKFELKNSRKVPYQSQRLELQAEIQNLRKQNNELLSYIDKLNQKIQVEQNRLNQKIMYYDNEINRLKGIIESFNSEIHFLKKQNKSLKENIEVLKKPIYHHDHAESANTNIQEINRLNNEIHKLNQQKFNLQMQLARINKEKLTDSQQKLNRVFNDALRKQNQQLSSKVKALQKQNFQLKKQSQKIPPPTTTITNNDYNNLKNKLSELQYLLSNCKQELQAQTQRNLQLNHQYSQKSNELQLLKLDEYKHELAKIELDGEKSNNKNLLQENQRLNSLLDEASQNLKLYESLKFQYDRLQQELRSLQENNKRLYEQINKKIEETRDTNTQLTELKLLLQSLDISGIQTEISTITIQLKDLKRKSHELQQYKLMVEKLKNEIIKLQEINIQLNQQTRNQSAKIIQLETQIENLKHSQQQYSRLIQQYLLKDPEIISSHNIEQQQQDDDEQQGYYKHNLQIQQLKSKVSLAIENLNHITSKVLPNINYIQLKNNNNNNNIEEIS